MKRLSPFLIIFTVFGVMVAFGFHLRRSFENQSATTQVASARTTDTEIMAGANPPHFKGVVNAPLILEEFGDFECPACAQLYQA